MKMKISRMIALMLVFAVLISCITPSTSAASPFYTTEIYGYEGKNYIAIKDGVPMRSFPANDGEILEKVEKNTPMEALGLYRTRKNTLWIKIKTPDHAEAWVWCGNVEEHYCSMVSLADYGYNFSFCDVCGHIAPTKLNAYEIDYDTVHIALAMLSLIPGIGNGFDV